MYSNFRRNTKAVQVDPRLIYTARITLLEKLYPRLDQAFDRGGQPTGQNFTFAKRVGPSLGRVTEARIVEEALKLMINHIREQGDAMTGIPWFDE